MGMQKPPHPSNTTPDRRPAGVSWKASSDDAVLHDFWAEKAHRRSPRYCRQESLAGFGTAGQAALTRSRVLVVGAGGLGSPVLAYLAAAGVGQLGIVDDDVVETSNLHRQVIHREAAVGRPKVGSAKEFVTALNPLIGVDVYQCRVDASNALQILADYDVVVDGTDNFETRYLLNDACVMLGLPLVWASIAQFAGQLGVVVPAKGPCYRCLFPAPPPPGAVGNCEQEGVLGVVPGVVGSLQAAEVIKLLTGIGEVAQERVLLYDALTAQMESLPLYRNPDCSVCAPGAVVRLGNERVSEADMTELESADVVLDVREPVEVRGAPWVGARELPWSLWDESVARDVAAEFQQTRKVVIVCASGQRSRAAAQMLHAVGADSSRFLSLRGGLPPLRGRAGE